MRKEDKKGSRPKPPQKVRIIAVPPEKKPDARVPADGQKRPGDEMKGIRR